MQKRAVPWWQVADVPLEELSVREHKRGMRRGMDVT